MMIPYVHYMVYGERCTGKILCIFRNGIGLLTKIALMFLICIPIGIQQGYSQSNGTNGNGIPKVYLECDECDFDYVRRNLKFVNYVRDRKQADIHILVTDRGTGGGGDSFRLSFIGLGAFEPIHYSLTYSAPATATGYEVDVDLTNTIRNGLVPFISQTDQVDNISVEVQQTETDSSDEGKFIDPWNFWVFEVEASGDYESEERETDLSFEGEVSANRVTEDWRIRNNFEVGFDRETFETDDGTKFKYNRSYDYDGSAVRSLSNHWSAGVFASGSSNTFSNMHLAVTMSPAIEWNMYPYSISDRKELTVAYRIGGRYNDYIDTTLYNVTSEYLLEHALNVRFDVDQPWGNINLRAEGSNFFKDIEQHRVSFDADFSLRLVKGLFLDLEFGVDLIHDQLHLPKEGASTEDILLKRRELATSYEYEAELGISYRFGSIYNNVVNDRL